jgi:hypothetical protein
VGGDHHEGDGRAVPFHIADEVDARAVGKHEIAQDHIRLEALDRQPRLFERAGCVDFPAFFLEYDREEVAQGSFVIDDEQVHGLDSRVSGSQSLGGSPRLPCEILSRCDWFCWRSCSPPAQRERRKSRLRRSNAG